MFFLLRAAFWLSLVVLLLPADVPSQATHEQISAADTVGAAQTLVTDMSGFCGRNPDACEAGGAALRQFGAKAQYGAKLLYGYLGTLTGDDSAVGDSSVRERVAAPSPADPAHTGVMQVFAPNGIVVPAPSEVALQTGTIRDLIVEAAGTED